MPRVLIGDFFIQHDFCLLLLKFFNGNISSFLFFSILVLNDFDIPDFSKSYYLYHIVKVIRAIQKLQIPWIKI